MFHKIKMKITASFQLYIFRVSGPILRVLFCALENGLVARYIELELTCVLVFSFAERY